MFAACAAVAPATRSGAEPPPTVVELHSARTTRPGRLLVELAPGHDLPPALRAGARHLFGDWWRVPVDERAGIHSEIARLAAAAPTRRIAADVVHRVDPPLAGRGSGRRTLAESPLSTDPLLVEQWNLTAVGAQAAWSRSTGDGVLVAVIDSGVSFGGPDGFCHAAAGEYDAVRDEEGPGEGRDLLGHGTFVASVVAECTGNGVGAAALAPDARILAIRACTANGECDSSDVATAIDWASTHGARVINLSLGMPCDGEDWPACSTAIENDALARASAAGVVVVASAGNGAQARLGFPANHPDVLGVGALDALLRKTSYSSWGSAMSVTAPGGEPGHDDDGDGFEDQIVAETLAKVCVPGLPPGFAYCRWSGTSFAAPHVAAAAALLVARHPTATAGQIRRAIEESALDLGAPGFDPWTGHGGLRADAAIDRLDEIVAAEPVCAPSALRLCLGGGRFALEVRWRDHAGRAGVGTALPLTAESGLFWFFDAENLEMLVKAVDGCSLNGHRWIFAAASTDVEYELLVTEVPTGASRAYRNPLGVAAPAFTETTAFPCASLN